MHARARRPRSNALAAVGGTTAGPGPCVVNVYINQEKKFAFVEMRTVCVCRRLCVCVCGGGGGGTERRSRWTRARHGRRS